MASSIMFTLSLLTFVVLLQFSTATTASHARLDNLDLVVDGTNVTLTVRNGENGKQLIESLQRQGKIIFLGCVTRPPYVQRRVTQPGNSSLTNLYRKFCLFQFFF